MSQQRDVIEQKGRNQIVRIRSDSETNLDDLFKAVMHPKDSQVPLSVPMRLRNLPPSFFKQPERGSKSASHSRESSSDTTYSAPPQSSSAGSVTGQQRPSGLSINHPRAHSSPATLQQTYNVSSPQHLRQPSFDITDELPLPPGWDMAKTPSGQRYFLNHITQTTTWEDPRKKLGSGLHSGTGQNSTPIPTTAPPPHSSTTVSTHSVNLPNLGALPEGWEQATTPEGEVYFINHIDRTTSWFDPRIPVHLQRPPVMQSHSNPHSQQPRPPPVLTSPPPPPPPPPPPTSQQQSQVQASSAASVVSQPSVQSITSQSSVAAAITTITGAVNSQLSLQQHQQKLRLHQLQMERERLRMRQEEILRQTVHLGYPMNNELLLRRTLGEELTIPTSPTSSTGDLPPVTTTGIDPFLGGTDFHSRQESTDSGLGLGPNYSLPNTPEDFLSNMDESVDATGDESTQGTDMGLDSLQGSNMDLGTENMDSDDLVPSLQDADLNADILNDVEALLNSNKEVILTWL